MAEEKRPIDEVRSDGGTSLVTEPSLAELKSEVTQIVTESKETIWPMRVDMESTRFCRWDHQSADGLKHKAENLNEEPEPFEGASDMRVRTADMLINEDVMLLVLSAMRAQINFRGTESKDTKKAGNMAVLMRWLIRNYWGVKWIRELLKLANYLTGDSPGVALLGIVWKYETALKMEKLTAEELMGLYLQNVVDVLQETVDRGPSAVGGTREAMEEQQLPDGRAENGIEANAERPITVSGETPAVDIQALAEQAAEDFKIALASEESVDFLPAKLAEFFPGIRPARAKKVIRELRERGRAEFPVPYIKQDGPDIQAKRLNEDWFVPLNTTDFQSARVYFEAEWLSKTQIIERKISQGWSDDFVEKVIGERQADGSRAGGHEGSAAFPDYVRDESGNIVTRATSYYKGLYQILTAFYQATNEDGVPGKYFVVFHNDVDVAATERKLLDYAHGGYPGHNFCREVLTSRLCDSRGVAELAGTYQGLEKLYCDSFGDHAQLAGVPPIITRNRQRMGALHIKPLMELPAKRDGDFAWMKPPEYPRTVVDMVKELRRQRDEYFGRTNEDVAPDVVQLQREFKVLWWLMNLREALVQVFQLCQQYMPDSLIQRITNRKGEALFKSREEIQGQFDLDLQFDPRDLDPAYLERVGKIVKELLMPMDRDKTIQTAAVVSAFMWRISPDLAEAALVDVEQANQVETVAEIKAYQEIRAGKEPELPDDGSINYELRLQLYRNMEQMNPAIYKDMAEDKLLILQSRLQRLQVLAQQFGENVEIGRQGGRAALPATTTPGATPGGAAPAASGTI
ncbi:MAG: hypothetical protein WC130_04465 [Kiritimatiellia bacterium]